MQQCTNTVERTQQKEQNIRQRREEEELSKRKEADRARHQRDEVGRCVQRVAVCCSVLQCFAVCFGAWRKRKEVDRVRHQSEEVLCSVLQCAAVCCSAFQFVSVC